MTDASHASHAALTRARAAARARLRAIQTAAVLSGVALATLAPGATAQTDRRGDGVRADGESPGERRRAARLDRPVRAATPQAQRVLDAFPARAADPQFAQAATPAGLADAEPYLAPSVADLDGDGDLDVLTGEYYGRFVYFENTAGAGSTPAFTRDPSATPLGLTSIGYDSRPSVADLDGDGDLDVLTGERYGGFVYFENTAGAGNTPAFTRVADATPFGLSGVGDSSTPCVADLDGDGDLDVLSGEQNGGFAYFENTAGAGNAPAFTQAVTPAGLIDIGRASSPSMADLDGDGDLDVLSGEQNGGFAYFENTASAGDTPTFTRDVDATPFGLTEVGYNSAPSVADLDGDGDPDVLVGDNSSTFAYFENTSAAAPSITSAPVTGDEGYRMLSAPADGATVDMLLGSTHTQGFAGADAETGEPTVYLYDESLPGAAAFGYRTPTDQSEAIGLGGGAFVYLFADDDASEPGVQGGFPKTLAVTGERPRHTFGWGADGPGLLTFTDTGGEDGWNLLGNPFGSWFDWDAVELTNVDAPVYVYDDAIASYRSYVSGVAGSLAGGIVAPFQGLWAKANAAAPGMTARAGTSNGGPLYKSGAAPTVVGLRLRPAEPAPVQEGGGPLPAGIESEAFLALDVPGAQDGVSPLDARALTPPAAAYVLLATEAVDADGAATALAIDARPEITAETTVELSLRAVGAVGAVPLVLDWPGLDLPDGWTVRLLDRDAGTSTALADGGSYAFNLGGTAARPAVERPSLTPSAPESLGEGRFALIVTPANVVDAEDAPTATTLSPAMPNPARGTARLTLTVATPEHVRAAVYDALGRQVAVLADGEISGATELRIDTSRLAAGVYVVRVDGASFAETRRLTIVR